ncbi:receptor blocking protein [Escherichia phage H8]|uniref:receptor blocking protein n=1 Tax=Escherichia phage H8 TaxID=2886919 RepID=UPI0001D25FB9|nr:receptor blocking protein [Escherichia phage H8]
MQEDDKPFQEPLPLEMNPRAKAVHDAVNEIIQDVIEDTMEDVMGTSFILEESGFDEVMDIIGTVVMVRAICRIFQIPGLQEKQRANARKIKRSAKVRPEYRYICKFTK